MHRHMHPYTRQNHSTERRPEPAFEPAENVEPQEEPELAQPAAPADEVEKDLPATEEISELDKAKAELEEMRLRLAAEMDNFKKRLTREHQEQMRYASEKVLSDLLPALDNLDMAIQFGSQHEACAGMMQGIELTRRQLLDAVGKSGLVAVGERGEPFNPEIHEAIGMEAEPDLEKGAVSKVMQRGYKLNERLLRPAKVMVNN